MIGAWLLLAAALAAEDDKPVTATVHGDVKSFFVATFPYEYEPVFEDADLLAAGLAAAVAAANLPPNVGLDTGAALPFPSDPTGSGIVDGRLKLQVRAGEIFRFDAHHAVSGIAGPQTLSGLGGGTGVALQAPEAVALGWTGVSGSGLTVRGRTDRLVAKIAVPNFDLAIGRQPISFGNAFVFAPMDLVNPFSPATIDTEYKPGVDAVRADVYAGMATQITIAAAYAGSWDLDGTVLAVNGQTTLGVTDVSLLLGEVHGDEVVGVGFVSSIGPIGIHGDTTFTLPNIEDEDPFLRAVLGAQWRPTGTSTLFGEGYVQTNGASDPAEYLLFSSGDRFARGELWQMGRFYAALGWTEQVTPLVTGSLSLIGNLEDPSMLVAPGFDWSVAGNASVGVGAFVGVGERPDDSTPIALLDGLEQRSTEDILADLGIRSEFGLYPAAVFVNTKAYF